MSNLKQINDFHEKQMNALLGFIGFSEKKCGVKDCEEYSVTEIELDYPSHFVPMCEGHSSFYLKELDLQESRAIGN